MYAYIKGEIVDITEDNVVLECHDIGYNIKVPFSVVQKLPGIGAQVRIYTYTCVREDAFILYGFLTRDDLWIFKKLITVNGIGPKGALGILSAMTADDLRFAIIAGAKSAERIILDLKDKITFEPDSLSETDMSVSPSGSIDSTAKNEAIEAMSALGYSPAEALKAVKQIEITPDMDAGAILKAALKVIR